MTASLLPSPSSEEGEGEGGEDGTFVFRDHGNVGSLLSRLSGIVVCKRGATEAH